VVHFVLLLALFPKVFELREFSAHFAEMEYSALETPSTSLTELETSTETSESEETSSFEQSTSNPMVNIHHMMQSELEKVIMRRLSGDIGAGIASTEMGKLEIEAIT
jgi:primase-polymerase (primpol)-like protein